MQVERLSAAVRPRPPWEAADLGFRMVRAWWRPLLGVWAAVLLPAAGAVALVCWEHTSVAALVFWWLKPLLDRPLLHVLSRALFGEVPGVRATLRALPGLLARQALWSLVPYRLAPARSFTLPVIQLEGLRGRERSHRIRVLRRQMGGVPTWLTVVCLHFEIGLYLGFFALVWMLAPPSAELELTDLLVPEGVGRQVLHYWVYVAVVGVVEPFYVAAGFSLYLHRRVYLEGWDLEIAFRRIARRVGRTAAAVLLALGFAALPAAAAPEPDPSDARRLIAEVMREPELVGYTHIDTWAWKSQESSAEEAGDLSLWLGDLFALGFRALGWGILALALFLVAREVLRRQGSGRRPAPGAGPVAPSLGPLDPRSEPLPDDVVAAARAAWAAGRVRAALSLLYRGALAHVVHAHGIELTPSDTEGQCLRRVRAAGESALARDFGDLTQVWQRVAYAHAAPSAQVFDDLCTRWASRQGAAR